VRQAEIFQKHPEADAYFIDGAYVPYAVVAIEKTFSDAELAAEYWAVEAKARAMKLTSRFLELQEQAATFQRFAQHAPFDEVN